MPQGFVTLEVLDNGGSQVTVPASSIQVVIGPSSAGTPNLPFATASQATLISQIGYGPLLEQAMLTIAGAGNGLPGGTVIVVKTTVNAVGGVWGAAGNALYEQAAVTVHSVANGPPAVLTVTAGHNLVNGAVVTITGATGDTVINGTWIATVLTSTTFSIPVTGSGSYSADSGSVQFTGLIFTTSAPSATSVVPTITLDDTNGAWDDFNIQFTYTGLVAGTVGTGPIPFTLSLDANRNTGPVQQLGAATSFVIPNTGITLNFTSTQVFQPGDYFTLSTFMPAWDTAGIESAFEALLASPFAASGWGGDTVILGPCTGANASTIDTYAEEILADNYQYTRVLVSVRDAKAPLAWGGPGESAATWSTEISTDYSEVGAKRIVASAGNYNMPSPTQAQAPVVPSITYRRNLGWALAARQISIPPQRSAGRVRDGSLQNIVINPSVDPTDGFVYWDERTQGGTLTAQRFSAATTRIPNLPGYYILVGPNLMSQAGSQFVILPQGNVIDVASAIFIQAAQQEINTDVLTNLVGGSLTALQASQIEAQILQPITINMVNTQEIQGAMVIVDTTNDVLETMNVNIACVVLARGYIETITATIALAAA